MKIPSNLQIIMGFFSLIIIATVIPISIEVLGLENPFSFFVTPISSVITNSTTPTSDVILPSNTTITPLTTNASLVLPSNVKFLNITGINNTKISNENTILPSSNDITGGISILVPSNSFVESSTFLPNELRGTSKVVSFNGRGNSELISSTSEELTGTNFTPSKMVACSPPFPGNWVITTNCILSENVSINGNVLIQNNSILTIPNGVTLTITPGNNITIVSGSGVLIKLGGTVIANVDPEPESGSTFIISIEEGSGVQGCEEFNECYFPYSQEVLVGDTVSWINNDSAAHTVTSGTFPDASGLFDSGIFMAGDTFDFTFDAPGIFPYYCVIHPWMAGEIVVD